MHLSYVKISRRMFASFREWYILYLLASVILQQTVAKRPNFMLIVVDDLGWGDLACYGHPTQEWNAIDEMAEKGIRFTQFYSAATFCTPSRAAMLTGRLPIRLNMFGDKPVFLPHSSNGLGKEEITLAELLKENGYETGMVGKWHLGINENHFQDGAHLPIHHGFNFVGTILPHTLETSCDLSGPNLSPKIRNRCFLYKNTTIVEQPLTLVNLTATLVEDTKAFLYDHHHRISERKYSESASEDTPFFFYLSFPQTHTPMFSDIRFKGRSRRGAFGDQIEEMAWAVNETLQTLRELDMARDTLVFLVSDHGPHREKCLEGGSVGPFSGGKGNFFEGGVRIPAIAYWPGTIPSGIRSMAVGNLMDIYKTFADIAGLKLDPTIPRDGSSLAINLLDKNRVHEHARNISFFYCNTQLNAVRYRSYKIHFYSQRIMKNEELKDHCKRGISKADLFVDHVCENHVKLEKPLIFNLDQDPAELFPLDVTDYVDLLQQVNIMIEKHTLTLPSEHEGKFDNRFTDLRLNPCCNPPYCVCQ